MRDILCALVGISTRTPYCSTVCLCLNNSLTYRYRYSTGRRGGGVCVNVKKRAPSRPWAWRCAARAPGRASYLNTHKPGLRAAGGRVARRRSPPGGARAPRTATSRVAVSTRKSLWVIPTVESAALTRLRYPYIDRSQLDLSGKTDSGRRPEVNDALEQLSPSAISAGGLVRRLLPPLS